MTFVGRWSPNKVRARVLDGAWPDEGPFGGMQLIRPTGIVASGTGSSATIGLNGSVEFSSCTSLSLNGVFSATYDNYMVVMRYIGTAADGIFMRLRAAGTDNSTASSYVYEELAAYSTTITGVRTTTNRGRFGNVNSPNRFGMSGNIYGPYLAQPTAYRTTTVTGVNGGEIVDYAGTHNQSTSYDGFTLILDTTNFTGLISVYGLVGA